MGVQALDHLNMTVQSFEDSAAWYARVLGFEVVEKGVYDGEPWGILKSGSALLCLYQHPELGKADSEGPPSGQHLNHFGLRISDRAAWEDTIAREKVKVAYDGPVRWPHSTSWYIEDPSGYEIEVALWDDNRIAF